MPLLKPNEEKQPLLRNKPEKAKPSNSFSLLSLFACIPTEENKRREYEAPKASVTVLAATHGGRSKFMVGPGSSCPPSYPINFPFKGIAVKLQSPYNTPPIEV